MTHHTTTAHLAPSDDRLHARIADLAGLWLDATEPHVREAARRQWIIAHEAMENARAALTPQGEK